MALGLGLIVGLQRERSGSPLAGFRTFPLVTIFGALAGFLSQEHGGWVLAGSVVALAAVIVAGNLERKGEEAGLTTEMALLVMFATGAFVMSGALALAAVVGGSVAVLLHLKPQLHSAARRLADPDFKAIMQLVLITLVILPILPNRAYGPYQVLNPFKIWLMMVLIVGISLTGYLLHRFAGARAGTLAGGLLGGLISSTATTVSFSRRTREAPETCETAALVILVASSILFVRVLLIVAASAPGFLAAAAGPVCVMLVVMLVLCWLWWRKAAEPAALPTQGNPSELKAALIFAGLYAVVLLATAAAKDLFGPGGLYGVAILSGLTDMDAITLSISGMVSSGRVAPGLGWRLIMAAALSNLVFKAALVALLGHSRLKTRVIARFGLAFAAGLALILLWPA